MFMVTVQWVTIHTLFNFMNIAQHLEKYKDIKPTVTEYRDERDEMIKKAVVHINELRKNTPYCNYIETPAKLAKRINMNKFLAGNNNNGELYLLLSECRKKNNYSKLYWMLDNKKK